jgi:tetratricopeptide (TPR) repeat protein
LTFAAASSFVLPWLAAREVDLAVRTWRDDPADAFVRLERARKLNVLSERPDLVAGAIAARTGDLERMRAAYERALERSPRNWYAHLELAILDANSGARDVALARLDEAQALNPLEPTIDEVRRLVAGGERVSLEVIRRTFVQRVQAITN